MKTNNKNNPVMTQTFFKIPIPEHEEQIFNKVPFVCETQVLIELFADFDEDDVECAIEIYEDMNKFFAFAPAKTIRPGIARKWPAGDTLFDHTKEAMAYEEEILAHYNAMAAFSKNPGLLMRKFLYTAFLLFQEEAVKEAIRMYKIGKAMHDVVESRKRAAQRAQENAAQED